MPAGWPIRSRRRSGWARALCLSPRRRVTTTHHHSRSVGTARNTAVRTTTSRSRTSSRAASPSTRHTAPARPARVSAPSLKSTRTWSSRIAPRASLPARSCHGPGCRPMPRGGSRSSRQSVPRTAGTTTLRSATSRPTPSTISCARRRTRRWSSTTATSGARTPTRPRSKASSPTWSGATARRTRTTSRPSSRNSWLPVPARSAMASGCARRSWESRSVVGTSGRSPLFRSRTLSIGRRVSRAPSPSASGPSPCSCSRRSWPGSDSWSTSGWTT